MFSPIEKRRRAALAMIQRALHADENAAAQAMDRSLRTYFYIKSSPEWLDLRDRLESQIRKYAWVEHKEAVESGKFDKAGKIAHSFDLLGFRKAREENCWVDPEGCWD